MLPGKNWPEGGNFFLEAAKAAYIRIFTGFIQPFSLFNSADEI
jgi:hypothetical protein